MEKIYTCGICGNTYSDIADRINCETTCLTIQRETEEAARRQKLEEEKEARKAIIDETYFTLNKLIREYMRDYGSLKIEHIEHKDSEPSYNWLRKWWM